MTHAKPTTAEPSVDAAPTGRVARIMSGHDRSLSARFARALGAITEPVYAGAVARRNRAFDGGRNVSRAHVPVVSIGNLTTGGTGKTPMTLFVLDRLIALGRTPAVLTRGYKADETGRSDEATLIAERLPNVPVIVHPDRTAGAVIAQQQHPDADVLVLDDGFQHRRLARDVDLVLIDATCPFGFDRLLPRGMLREPIDSLKRATAVIVTHAERVDTAALEILDQRITEAHGKPPVAHFEHAWQSVVDAADQPIDPAGRNVVAFCGIGNPAAFIAEAARRTNVVAEQTYADHHAYTDRDVTALCALAERHNADALLTTEKDWVKLRVRPAAVAGGRPIWRSVLRLEPREGQAVLDPLLDSLPDPAPNGPSVANRPAV